MKDEYTKKLAERDIAEHKKTVRSLMETIRRYSHPSGIFVKRCPLCGNRLCVCCYGVSEYEGQDQWTDGYVHYKCCNCKYEWARKR